MFERTRNLRYQVLQKSKQHLCDLLSRCMLERDRKRKIQSHKKRTLLRINESDVGDAGSMLSVKQQQLISKPRKVCWVVSRQRKGLRTRTRVRHQDSVVVLISHHQQLMFSVECYSVRNDHLAVNFAIQPPQLLPCLARHCFRPVIVTQNQSTTHQRHKTDVPAPSSDVHFSSCVSEAFAAAVQLSQHVLAIFLQVNPNPAWLSVAQSSGLLLTTVGNAYLSCVHVHQLYVCTRPAGHSQ